MYKSMKYMNMVKILPNAIYHEYSNVTKNINVIMNEFYDYGRAKCLNILVHNKLICLYGSKVANCHFQY